MATRNILMMIVLVLFIVLFILEFDVLIAISDHKKARKEIHISDKTAEGSWCPLEYSYSKGCQVQLKTEVVTKGTVTVNLSINQKQEYDTTVPDIGGSLFLHIDQKCRLISVIENVIPENGTLRFIESLPHKTILAGVLLLEGYNTELHELLSAEPWELNAEAKRAPIAFLTYYGYPGHLSWEAVHHYASLENTFYFGTPFPYELHISEDSNVTVYRPVSPGGSWQPLDCVSEENLALIIPYRNRTQHRMIFVQNIMRFLQMQKVAFTVFIVEQAEPEIFNRAALMNIGYLEAKRTADFTCYIFHDIDLIPEDLTNLYRCAGHPRHLAVSRSVTKYLLSVRDHYVYFGGAIAMTPQQIEKINGFPNLIYGWGGEDDEIYGRVKHAGYRPLRYPTQISTYISLEHGKEDGNPHMHRNARVLHSYASFNKNKDGLTSVKYTLLSHDLLDMYTHIYVRIPGPTTREELEKYNAKLQLKMRNGMWREHLKELHDAVNMDAGP